MLKCGQKDNKNYTFGVRQDQIKESDKKEIITAFCYNCGHSCKEGSKFCSSCGVKM